MARDVGNLQIMCSRNEIGCTWKGELRNMQVIMCVCVCISAYACMCVSACRRECVYAFTHVCACSVCACMHVDLTICYALCNLQLLFLES